MAASHPPTPFKVTSFSPGQEGEATPSDFLTFLHTLIAENLNDNGPVLIRIPASSKDSYVTLVGGLSEHFLVTFPNSSSELWSTLQEKIKLCSTSLDVIERAALRVDGLFAESDECSIVVLRRLFEFFITLSSWKASTSKHTTVASPSELRRKVIETIGAVIDAFSYNSGNSVICRGALEGSLRTLKEMLDLYPAAVWPLQLSYLAFPTYISAGNPDFSLKLNIENPAQFYQHSSSFASKFDRETALATKFVTDFLLSSDASRPGSQRIDALGSVLKCVQRLLLRRISSDVIASIPTMLLVFRLREGPIDDWQAVDKFLLDIFNSGNILLQPSSSNVIVLELALREEWRESGQLLTDCACSAIRASLKDPDRQVLQTMRNLFRKKEPLGAFTSLANEIDTMLTCEEVQRADNVLLGKRKRSEDSWKNQIVQTLRSDFLGDDNNWIPKDNLSDASWISHILETLGTKLFQLNNLSTQSRLRLISVLKKGVCSIAHLDRTNCPQSLPIHSPELSIIPIYTTYLTRLYDGDISEATVMVSRAAQDALAACLRHHARGPIEKELGSVSELIRRGLQSHDRATRLASGRALVELIHLCRRVIPARRIAKGLDRIFDMLTVSLQHNKDAVKETTLITLGLIGKMPDQDILGRALFCLFTQLDRNSILLKGVTYMQLLALAKHHKKTPYMLVSPYMQQISTFVVSIVPRRPDALLETCRFLSLSPKDLLSVTLPHTLPQLFATCDSAALDNIHKELGKSISGLFLNASADVLAHVFLLKKTEEIDKALHFILRTLSEAANNVNIGLTNVIKSCIIPLLGKLIIAVGDPDSESSANAMQAIQRVERALDTSANGQQSQTQQLGIFLKGYMLGIIAILSDVLQDVQGRKTDDIKCKVLFGLNALIKEVGSSISAVAPQIMATLQTTVYSPPLSIAALHTWHSFLTTLALKDVGSHRDESWRSNQLITSSTTPSWNSGNMSTTSWISHAYQSSQKALKKIRALRHNNTMKDRFERILERTFSDNNTVVAQALEELKTLMLTQHADFVQGLVSGDFFDPLVGYITKSLLTVVCRDGENIETLRLLAFECIGILGAADPDRFDMFFQDDGMVVLSNYTDETEAMQFALHLVQNTLVGAFRSTSDIKYQSHLAFAIQELLKFCKFTPELAIPGASVPLKVRTRWSSLPKHVLQTVTPLLEARFAAPSINTAINTEHPVYLGQTTYREWIQLWAAFLITRTSGDMAKTIFNAFRLAVRNKDVGVAHQLLPHLILNILIAGKEDDTQKIRSEIVAVLEDQLDGMTKSSPDKRLLSAQIISMKSGGISQDDLQVYYDRLHEIYSHLDEPDGMEGISAFITLPSIEHQIRQHESTGKWTSAQSCWEVRLQQSPDKLDYHLGLLRCLRNLGHYDSLRTHIQGVLVRNPGWEEALAGFQVEGAWMSSDWDTVQTIVEKCKEDTWEMAIARLLLSLKSSDASSFTSAISATRLQLGTPITAAGERGYRRAYDAVLKLHLVHDIEMIRNSVTQLHEGGTRKQVLSVLFSELSHRLNSTLPTFRTREPILSVHRTTFSLSQVAITLFKRAIGRAWLDSAKIARKAGHWQTAYSAVLQARECQAPLTFFQSAKLVRASGEPLRALYELESALQATHVHRQSQAMQSVIDLTEESQIDNKEIKRVEAKAKLLRAQWMQESERYNINVVAMELSELAKELSEFESAHFHAGHFQDECYKAMNSTDKRSSRGPLMNLYTVRSYATAIRLGSKYAYQTIPRLLSLWLDMGEDNAHATSDAFAAINTEVQRAILHTPIYKWLTAFPQIVSRVDHKNNHVFTTLSSLIATVLQEYPQQGLWLFMSVMKSTKPKREKRGRVILEQLKNNPGNVNSVVPKLISQAVSMATELLRLCDFTIKDDATKTLSMIKDIPTLFKLAPSRLIIPLQESMIVTLPATSSSKTTHQPFPPDAPTIMAFHDEIDIMKSMAKPRKITIQGSDGHVYMFLGKPKDDLRKDARLMDFNSIINKLLKTNSESRRRQLRIRTYSVVTLNEECGFIQWVPNTSPVRPILLKYYSARGIEAWGRDMTVNFAKIKDATDKEACKIFQEKVLVLFPPIFHEWFLDTFPEPTAWLSSRLAFGRTAAVMSMVGFILGLGDRHLENLLLDINSGDVVHVDFNSLFEKASFNFFLSLSMRHLRLLRDNKDVLMSVLDAFIHDPLVEWEDEKRRMERQAKKAGDVNAVKESVDLRRLAKTALTPIERKLRGMYAKDTNRNDRRDKEISTSNLVQMLIEEATDLRNLSKMYPGWAPWH
ncbi:hypothetical protein EW145_g35 [Phellinidium pouzarii]|uniref:non-specific serine/threonine protein kinase n=1 Tax=Phellinidium pouzarii TaxID=167371 RepID=A0A4S4LJW9_9AGAM|nr:hypothetical protein EW145_g35 [Phellinidium pouzarii]